jgi:hypothetical protein
MQKLSTPLYQTAINNSQSLYEVIKTGEVDACTKFYDPIAILECPKGGVLIGRTNIESFWNRFSPLKGGNVKTYRSKLITKKRDSITLNVKWLLEDNQYVVSLETWSTKLHTPCVLLEQKVAFVGGY